MTEYNETAPAPRRSALRRAGRVLGLSAGVLTGVTVLAVGVILVGANTGPGRRLLMKQTTALTGGMVNIAGMSGRFPDNFHLDSIALKDKDGVWLSLRNIDLNWSPLSMVWRTARIYALKADELNIPRLPVSDPTAQPAAPSSGAKSRLGLSVDIRTLAVQRITVGAALAGVPASFSLAGHGSLSSIDPVIDGLTLPTLPKSDIALHVKRLDASGQIDLATQTGGGKLGLHLDAQEGTDGFAAARLKMPQLTPLSLALDIKGPTNAAALGFSASAGPVKAKAEGELNLLAGDMARLSAQFESPQLALTPDIGWDAIHLAAQLKGKMTAPNGTATLQVDRLAAAGAAVGTLKANFTGQSGQAGVEDLLHLVMTADGVRIPGSAPNLLASAPVQLDAKLSPQPAGKPLQLDISHPLLHLTGSVLTAAPQRGTLTLSLPDLRPIGQVAGTPLQGNAGMTAQFDLPAQAEGDTHLKADGALAITGGQPQAVGLIGPKGTFALAATMRPHTAPGAAASVSSASAPASAPDASASAHTPAVTPKQPGAAQPAPSGVAGSGAEAKQTEEAKKADKPAAQAAGQQIDLASLTVDGQALHLKAQGRVNTGQDLDVTSTLALPDLARALPSLRGGVTLALSAKGLMQDFAAKLHLEGDPGTATMPRGPVVLDADLAHLPSAPAGTVEAHGSVNRAPLLLNVALAQDETGARQIDLKKLSWNSVQGQGALSLAAGEVVPLGTLDVKIGRLADLKDVIGQPISGALAASVKTTQVNQKPLVALKLDGNVAMPQARIGRLSLAGTVKDPAAHPDADLTLKLGGLAAAGMTGQARVTARGPDNAMALTAQIGPATWSGSPLSLDTAALLNLPAKQVRLQKLAATAKQENLRLLAPALLSFGETMGVDRLRVTLGTQGAEPATADIAGRIKPTLAATVDVRNLTPALAHPFMPDLHAQGTLAMQAKVSGTMERPQGQVHLSGNGLRMQGASAAASLPPLHLDATADLAGTSAKVRMQADAGAKLALGVNGTAPLTSTGPISLRTSGHLDLAIANGYLGAQARQALGQVQLALQAEGTLAAPRIAGTVDLQNAEFQDFAQGVHLSAINGRIVGQGNSIVIQNLTAKAGDGTMGVTGSVGVLAPGLPVDIHFVARDARPVSSDLITAIMNSDMTIKGQAAGRMDVVGNVDLRKVEINIPNSLPSSVARLDVVRPGDKTEAEKAATTSATASVIGLDLTLTSPGKFFVRGHGLDAEMAGKLKVKGTSAAPLVSGGFDLKRGNFDLAGISLNFTKGRVAFNGSSVDHKLDPTLDFEADRAVNGETAMLKVGGYASAPKISFESIPSLPQDQVLAMLLFGTDAHSLSSTQMVELGTALATLTGVTTFDPMGTLRKTLHLDRLAVGGGSGVGNGGTTVEAGKYVMRGVYVGAKQATSGSGTQAQVQVDLTKHLKLNTTVGTGGNVTGFTTPENDPGSSVGLLWQYRY
ncbi:translocation/assembly module TamB domain-containing protein [Acetobacter persici]|uniref:translocation/assembly module TamB domain-containing protein n=1 Tax=Acetobacter persici TaxID=1076596 RepID=UPI001EEDA8C7|nr:translocation/assembly module TamB domain-containing protein [Acetobacter persici]MCG0996621.1 translocation/assembly module TamB domain-containing protein [Acetobacter persici]